MRGRVVALAFVFACGSGGARPAKTPAPKPAPAAQDETETDLGPAPEKPGPSPVLQPTPRPIAGAADPIDDKDVLPLDGSPPPGSRTRDLTQVDPFVPPFDSKAKLEAKKKRKKTPEPPLGNDPVDKDLCRKKPEQCRIIGNNKL